MKIKTQKNSNNIKETNPINKFIEKRNKYILLKINIFNYITLTPIIIYKKYFNET